MKYYVKLVACLLAVTLSVHLSVTAHAAPDGRNGSPDFYPGQEAYLCGDGSVITITLSVDETKAAGSTSGSKTYICSNNGNTLWTAVLNASFSYTGYSSGCTGANCQVTFQNNQYSLQDKTVMVSGNTAIATITIVHKILGITISTNTLTLTLSCDSNGNLS